MFKQPIDRRLLLKGAASLAVLAPLPAWASTGPTVTEVAFDPAIPALGNPDGDVTIAEFVDYQCPICKLVFVELKKLMEEDSGVRLVMKDWPIFGDVSRDAARVTLLSGEHYGAAVDALMTNQRGLSERRTNDILSSVGVDVAMVRADLAIREPDIDAALVRTEVQAAAFKLRGTPALVIGGNLYRRGMPVSELRQAVAKARSA
ncbi:MULTISPECIES: thioredoxin domain-containing protein [unclassified Mesorhizobium]|uniref:DsbA family protein n=1 Tax=unclassified Mesorhizobium TaxID=325217 RepID=UPI0003CDF3C3|nr:MULTISPECIES: thioredoxin domain-containing protein [unclassified Mesorhizobium]ESW88578.1 DSBA oxidoreductase [Mesorhizobium sp. LSJC269B00]ESX70733.1 DSBA oxidoreductase [Mesorhizobium sp. LSHC414A00]